MYGVGTEVDALVVDVGTLSTRMGYAGEDVPKGVFPTVVGTVPLADDANGSTTSTSTTSSFSPSAHGTGLSADRKHRWFAGTQQLHRRDRMSLVSPVRGGVVHDWDALEHVLTYGTRGHLGVATEDHPILLAEPNVVSRDQREKMVSLLFDTLRVPGVFFCKSAVLAAFSIGKSTALIVDSGAGQTSVVPVYEGYVLSRGVKRTRFAGDLIDTLLMESLLQPSTDPASLSSSSSSSHRNVDDDVVMSSSSSSSTSSSSTSSSSSSSSSTTSSSSTAYTHVPLSSVASATSPYGTTFPALLRRDPRLLLRPLYTLHKTVANNGAVVCTDASASSAALSRTHASYHDYMLREHVRDFKESVCFVRESPPDPAQLFKPPALSYELPDGQTIRVDQERCEVSELLFSEQAVKIPNDFDKSFTFNGLHNMIQSSVSSVDPDVAKEMYGTIYTCGGNSMLTGFTSRLTREVPIGLPPAYKVRLLAPSVKSDPKIATWVGGSILGSLGTFHQMWMSRAEYEEHGAKHIHTKCP